MKNNKKQTVLGHTLKDWEAAGAAVKMIIFSKFQLKDGLVTKAFGVAAIGCRYKCVTWNHLGKCYRERRRLQDFDINFDGHAN